MRGEIAKLATFLQRLVSEEQLDKLREHLRFDNFAKNESVNFEIGKTMGVMEKDGAFIRKGFSFFFLGFYYRDILILFDYYDR